MSRDLARYLIRRLMVALLFSSGCYHWVPIEPSYTNERLRKFDELRIGGEGGDRVYDAALTWPMLTATRYGKPVEIDLGLTLAEKRQMTPGSIAAIVIPSVLGGIGLLAAGVWVGLSTVNAPYLH